MRFCPKCGKSIKDGEFCDECRESTILDTKNLKLKNLLICEECSRIFLKNTWKSSYNLKKDIENHIKEEIKKNQRFDSDVKITVFIPGDFKEKLDYAKKKVLLEVKLGLKKQNQKEDYLLNQRLIKEICDKCGKKNTEYFEGVFQLRNPSEKLLQFLDEEFYNAEKERIFVTKYQKLKNGYDYYITSKKFVVKLAHLLQEKFGGVVKVSEQHFSRDSQTSKDIFRVNAFFMQSPVSKGDIIIYEDKVAKVTALGKNIFAKELGTDNKIKLEHESEIKKLEPKETTVVKIYPNKEALDPETFQAMELVTKIKKLKEDMKIRVVKHKNLLYQVNK
jgi:NMD protein affecting ribosome stability and mRNA decay